MTRASSGSRTGSRASNEPVARSPRNTTETLLKPDRAELHGRSLRPKNLTGDNHDPDRFEGRSRVSAGAVRHAYPARQQAETEIGTRPGLNRCPVWPIARACWVR